MNQIVTKEALTLQGHGNGAPASEATHIEQSRAIAQVQGALVVAQQRPRDTIVAAERMREACQLQALADHAFFRYSRGGSQISGPSIHLATELARCWGNVDHGITELRRDDLKRESEMLAYAWDLETNTRVTNSFIVPHRRDKKGGPIELIDMRDIYENNANQAARRLRECIFRILPKAYIEEAKSVCMETLQHGGGEPIEKRREKLLEAFAALSITRRQIEQKMGRAADKLTALDIGNLRVVYQSIRRGEVDKDEEFGADAGAEVASQLKKQSNGTPAEAESAAPEPPQDEPTDAPAAGESEAGQDQPDLLGKAVETGKAKTELWTAGTLAAEKGPSELTAWWDGLSNEQRDSIDPAGLPQALIETAEAAP